MTEPRRIGGIEIEENLRHERQSWIFERIGWAALGLLILLAVLGLFGKGVLSKASVDTGDGAFHVECERFSRFHTPFTLRFRVQTEGLSSPEARIWLNADYLQAIRIEQIQPEPESQRFLDDGVLYTFPATAGDRSTEVSIYAVAEKMGRHAARLGSSPEKTVDLWQFVFP